jgi:hypothetical protein
MKEALQAGANASLRDNKGRTLLDYLNLANCGKSPFHDPVEDNRIGYTRCTAFLPQGPRKARKLLRDAIDKKK